MGGDVVAHLREAVYNNHNCVKAITKGEWANEIDREVAPALSRKG